jgi:hypothetical protein
MGSINNIYMKKVVGFFALCLLGGPLHAQGWFAQWFEQGSTQIKYYIQQIAELEVYIKDLEKGYSIVEDGLRVIGQIKQGEFDLHNAFYDALDAVNPNVSSLGECVEIVALQAAIIERFSESMSRYRSSTRFGASEVEYIGQVYQTVLTDGLADVNALIDILTADKLKMSDDQRMARIRALDLSMRQRYELTAGFTNGADMLDAQRGAALGDIGTLQTLYGIPVN